MPTLKLTDRTVASARAAEGDRLELWDTALKGLYLRVSADTKIWGYRYRRPDGSQPRVRLGHYVAPEHAVGDISALTVAGARAKARKIQTVVDDGGDPATARQLAKAEAKAEAIRTVHDLAEAYFMVCETGEYRPSRRRKRAQTIRAERYLFKRYLTPLASIRVEALTRDAVRKLLRDLLAAGRGVTSNRVRGLLRQIYAWGVLEGRVNRNPAGELADLAEEIPRTRILTDDETRLLWKALENPEGLRRPLPKGREEAVMVGRPVRIAIQLAMLTLQRRAEVAMMRVAEIDFGAAVWTIPAEKTKAGRVTAVPLCRTAIELIQEALALRPEPQPGEAPSPYVFVGRSKSVPHVSPAAISHAMRDLREGIGSPDITTHDLRRSGATRLAIAGVSPFILSKLLNHAGDLGGGSPITMAVYVQHNYMAEKRAAIAQLETLILAVVRPTARDPEATPDYAVKARSALRFYNPNFKAEVAPAYFQTGAAMTNVKVHIDLGGQVLIERMRSAFDHEDLKAAIALPERS
ncbi:MAG: tyrosine-type recombinase/integrase [Brevundimonas sp.]